MTAFCISAPFHLTFVMLQSWITIVDGGKSKRCPKWAWWLCKIGIVETYLVEISLGLLEYRRNGAQHNAGAIDGETSALKYTNGFIWAVVLGILTSIYGHRISSQLKGGKEPTPQFLKIRRMCRVATILLSFGALIKLAGIPVREGKVCQTVTPCSAMSNQVSQGAQRPDVQAVFARRSEAKRSELVTTGVWHNWCLVFGVWCC